MTELETYYDFRDALEKLPSKRLIRGPAYDGYDVCAIGAIGLRDGGWAWGTSRNRRKHNRIVDFHIIGVNEAFEGTPEERYVHVLQHVNNRIASILEGAPIEELITDLAFIGV